MDDEPRDGLTDGFMVGLVVMASSATSSTMRAGSRRRRGGSEVSDRNDVERHRETLYCAHKTDRRIA